MFHPSSSPKRQFAFNPQMPPLKQMLATPLPPAPESHTVLTPAIRVVSARQVRPGMRFGKLLMLLMILLTLDSVFLRANPTQAQNWYLFIIWAAYAVLFTIVGLLGAWTSRKEIIRPYIGSRPERVIFLIPTAARKATLPGLRRVVDSILYCATACLPNSEVQIVIEEGAEAEDEKKDLCDRSPAIVPLCHCGSIEYRN